MKVVKSLDIPIEESEGSIFFNRAGVQRVIDQTVGSNYFAAAIVHFPPGHRTKWHVHDCDQILYVINGKGIVANEDCEYEVTPGVFIFIPAGEKHWHGSKGEEPLSHISITKIGSKVTILE